MAESTKSLILCVWMAALSSGAAGQTFDDLRFRSIGPAVMGGRIASIAVVESDPSTMYIGAASGGVWKTINNGTTWTAVFDEYGTSSVGDVTVSSSDPDVVWVGTGEDNNRQSTSFGDGVYKSIDAGKSWTHLGLSESGHIGKVIIDPSSPERVFVAAGGSLWRAGGDRGVFRTLDGGKSWTRVLEIDDDTGVTTLALDPVNANVLYAAAYQRRRTPWGFDGGGLGSGLYKTVDGGDSWNRLTEGLPEGPLGRIGITVFDGDARVVFALIEHKTEGGLYRSDDRGESWTKVNELNPRPMYYSKVIVDPTDVDRVYVLGAPFYVSEDGGESFTVNREMTPRYDVGVHGDHHALWIDPNNSNHLVLGGDGGLYFSWDRSRSFRKINNIPLTQFYAIDVDMDEPYNIYGGAQDTHSWMGPSATRNQIGIVNSDWVQTNFGDGMYQQADPADPDIVYTEAQGGSIVRLDRKTGNRRAIRPYPDPDENRYRFHWTSPIAVSRHDSATVFLGGNRLFVTNDRGDSWQASADLTRNEDRDELPIMGVLPSDETLSRNDGVGEWGTITTIAESPVAAGVLYVGTDDGRIQLSRDNGETWTSLEGALPNLDVAQSKISRVVASAASASRAYVSVDRHMLGDFAPYLFATETYGESWVRIALPDDVSWVNVIVEHPANGDLLFVGTETSLLMSLDRGSSWLRMKGGFPTVAVDDLVIHPRDDDLVVGTHGRSIYILDDIGPLARFDRTATSPQLFTPRDAVMFLPWKHESYGAQGQFVGENPPAGAIITYHLPETVESVTLTVADASGNEIRRLGGPANAGFNRVVWDLRSEPPEGVEDARGPFVPVGSYGVTLDADGDRATVDVSVRVDPRVDVRDAELRERYEFLSEVNALRQRIQDVVRRADELTEKSKNLERLLDDDEEAMSELSEATDAVTRAKEPLAGRSSFRNPTLSARASRLFTELSGDEVQQGTLHGPTSVQRTRLVHLRRDIEDALDTLDAAITSAVPKLNKMLTEGRVSLP